MKRALTAAAALSVTLTACTGTLEEPVPITLVTADASGTAPPPAPNALRAIPVANPSGGTKQNTTATITGVASVRNGANVAVALTDRVELRDAALGVTATFHNPAGTDPTCYTRLRASETGSRVAVLSACPDQPRRIVLYDTNQTPGSPASVVLSDTLSGSTIPTFTYDPAFTHIAPQGNTVLVSLPTGATGASTQSTLYRVAPDGPDADTTPDITPLFTSTGSSTVIRDLVVAGGAAYAATDTGIRTAGTAGLGETPVIPGTFTCLNNTLPTRCLWAENGLIAAWSNNASTLTGNLTVARLGDFSARSTLSLSNVRDVTFTPDNYMYVTFPNSIVRYDVAQPANVPGSSDPAFPAASVQSARFTTWVLGITP